MQIVSLKCQIMFSGKNMENSLNLSSAELGQRAVMVKVLLPRNYTVNGGMDAWTDEIIDRAFYHDSNSKDKNIFQKVTC